MLRFDHETARAFVEQDALDAMLSRALKAQETLLNGDGTSSDMLGWRALLMEPDDALLEQISATAREVRQRADVFVCIGIGGSYLGARAVVQALTPYFDTHQKRRTRGKGGPEILFAGNHLSGAYLRELLAYLEGKSVYVNVISKSGTTLEPALAFRLVRQWMEDTFDDADQRIIVTTDPSEGALNQLQQVRGYRKFEIPRDVGGRFSVLTPVGLLPIAVAGVDVRSLLYGAVSACDRLSSGETNAAVQYAALRNVLLERGYAIELLAVFEPSLSGIGGWWQQLFGESEGKDGKGLFPTTAQYSTDLHSLGQYMQEGRRVVIETFVMAEDDGGAVEAPGSDDNLDKLNYLTGKTLTEINRKAYEGTDQAHRDGGVPTMTVWLDRIAPGPMGELLYFFEHSVAISGYLLGVNPFNQPGVEAYKHEMFERLGKFG